MERTTRSPGRASSGEPPALALTRRVEAPGSRSASPALGARPDTCCARPQVTAGGGAGAPRARPAPPRALPGGGRGQRARPLGLRWDPAASRPVPTRKCGRPSRAACERARPVATPVGGWPEGRRLLAGGRKAMEDGESRSLPRLSETPFRVPGLEAPAPTQGAPISAGWAGGHWQLSPDEGTHRVTELETCMPPSSCL